MEKTFPTASRRRNGTFLLSRNFLLFLLTLTIIGAIIFILIIETWPTDLHSIESHPFSLYNSDNSEYVTISNTNVDAKPRERQSNCTFHSCFDVFKCGYNDETKMRVYIYPYKRYLDGNQNEIMKPISTEFQQIIQTIANSEFYTNDPNNACVFVPSLDLLNQDSLDVDKVSQILTSLPYWNNGTNHLLFNMVPGFHPTYTPYLQLSTGQAIVAGAGMSTRSYRRTLDVSVPQFNPLFYDAPPLKKSLSQPRQYQLISAQLGLHDEYTSVFKDLLSLHTSQFLLLDSCDSPNFDPSKRCADGKVFGYPQILQDSDFCLVVRGNRLMDTTLSDVLSQACIPVIVADGAVMPFDDVLDWHRAAVFVRENDLYNVIKILSHYSPGRIEDMRKQVSFYWSTYFHSMAAITMATLQTVNDRIFPHASRSYREWNEKPDPKHIYNPLFLPLMPAQSIGFTAVILTYDRLESLFNVIERVANVNSLAKVVVVWNNQNKAPPPMSAWPKINKPLKVIRTKHNRLSNRFYPYTDIETDCVLALDDDIVMLTTDELEFAYEVWRSHSDRLVGFPSRLHLWDNATNGWRYQSEWTNEISMVLTGAAFYHKYFGYLYTTKLSPKIKKWVDDNLNCEDIAMNFVIANTTGKAPIKVAPRKKFTCPTCTSTDMLSTDIKHMLVRSECINKFTREFQFMPLKTVEFRADPVLYKDNITDILKLYSNVGSL